ncbi:MAG: NUDIX hydrolase [Acidimicrobiia bacterium]
MAGRAPFQVLVLPYHESSGDVVYALFRRTDTGYWQGVAGGGEDGESPLDAARRELAEETGIGIGARAELLALDSRATIPVVHVTGEFSFGADVLVIPEFSFGARCSSRTMALSDEHSEYAWLPYDEALKALNWDSNRNALWELDHRLRHHPQAPGAARR